MIIGYQGEYGSNAERAARLLAERAGLDEYELEACRTSENVVRRLLEGRIDLGVYALENTVGGTVAETEQATRGRDLVEHERISFPVVHCLFARAPTPPDQLKAIFSHPQALVQCNEHIEKLCPNAITSPAADTAAAANLLSQGEYPPGTGVICTHNAGDRAGLTMLADNFQDRPDNATTFALVGLPVASVGAPADASEQITAAALTPKTIDYAVKALIAATILAAFAIRDYLGWSSWDSALAVTGVAATIVLFLSSRRLENLAHRRALAGYWRYELTPIGSDRPMTQAHELVRVVHIDADDTGALRLRGWREGDGSAHRWETKETLVSRPGTKKGRLLYEYTNTHDHPDDPSLDGIVHLAWNRSHPARPIRRMSGWYTGFATGDVGRIRYERIDEDTFDRLRLKRGVTTRPAEHS